MGRRKAEGVDGYEVACDCRVRRECVSDGKGDDDDAGAPIRLAVSVRAGQLHRDPMISLSLDMPLLAPSSWIVYCLIDSGEPNRPCRTPSLTVEWKAPSGCSFLETALL